MENALEGKRTRRWGVNRWWILLFTILMIVVSGIWSPVLPHIQVAPERLVENPIVTLPVIGPIHLVNTLTTNVLVMLVIIWIAWLVRSALSKGEMVPRGIAGAMDMAVEGLYNLAEGTAGAKWARVAFPWFATFLIYILIANLVRILPFFETIGVLHHAEEGHAILPLGGSWAAIINDPGEYILAPFFRGMATDLNFTVALAIISVVATQVIGVQAQGIGYFSKFFNVRTLFTKPFLGFMDFLVGLLELISTLALLLSFSFRLFGNIFSGMVLLALVSMMVPVFVPSLIMAFEVFIGVIQAFVFGMLTLVFMSQAVTPHGGEGHHD